MTKRPTARTLQIEASDSSAVSWSSCLDSAGGGVGVGSVFSAGVVTVVSGNLGSPRLAWRAEDSVSRGVESGRVVVIRGVGHVPFRT